MNIFNISIKLFLISSNNNKINLKSFLPFLGTSLGVFAFIISLTFMETIELDMMNNILKITPKNKIMINHLSNDQISKFEDIFLEEEINYYIVEETNFLVKNNLNFVKMLAFNDLKKYVNTNLKDNYNKYSKEYDFIVGDHFRGINDKIVLISTSNFNFLTGIPKKYEINITGTIDFDFLGYDERTVLISSKLANQYNIFNKSYNKYFYIDSDLYPRHLNLLKKINSSVKVNNWHQEYSNLFNSVKIEKILYSIFGIVIIVISNFTFLVILSSRIIDKIKEFAIIEVLGFSKKMQTLIIIMYAFFQNIISLILGILLSYLFLFINNKYDLIGKIFNNNILLNINFEISILNIFYICCFSFFSLLVAMIYPINLLNKISIKNKLNY